MLVTMLASDPRRHIGAFVTGIAGLAFTIWSVVAAIKGARTRKWLTGHGIITVSRVEPDWRDRSGFQFYRVLISYTFSAAGSSRVGHQVSIGDGGGGFSAQDAQRRAQRYAAGTTVEIYYDPLDPSHSVLERGISGNTVAAFLFGVLNLAVAAWLLLHGV